MILDLASLRTAVALRVVERMRPEERFAVGVDGLSTFVDAWRFLQVLFTVCENDDEGVELNRQARQPTFKEDPWANAGAMESQGVSTPAAFVARDLVGVQWLQDNLSLVRATMSSMVDQIRSMLDFVGEAIEGGGTTLNDVFADNPDEPAGALAGMLANMQVWGTLGDPHAECEPASAQPSGGGEVCNDRDAEFFLRKDMRHDYFPERHAFGDVAERLNEVSRTLSPDAMASYHRRLTRARVTLARKELRRRLNTLHLPRSVTPSSATTSSGLGESDQADRLLRTVHSMLGDVEGFVSSLDRFFKSVDLTLPYNRQQSNGPAISSESPMQSDSSDEKWLDGGIPESLNLGTMTPQPDVDHAASGYIMHIDCGHNGLLDEVDMRQLSLHLRAARFGHAPPEYECKR